MNIPVLMYHALTEEKVDNAYTITVKDFRSHMKFLRDNGYNCLSAEEYYGSLLDGGPVSPSRDIIITFDDGHESNYSRALPVLREFGFIATFFITTDWTGRPEYMSGRQLKELKKAGMSVQSHAKTHRFLDRLRPDEVALELKDSKRAIEDLLGSPVSFISFPGGRYNRGVIECARETGYRAFFSSLPFSIKNYDDNFLIGRYAMKYSQGRIRFEKILAFNRLERSAVKCAYYGKDALKKVLGNDIYYTLWKKYITR